MNYEIGLSSSTINALKDLGGFSIEKIQQLYPIFRKQAQVEGWIGIGMVLILFLGYGIWLKKTRKIESFDLIMAKVGIGSILLIIILVFFSLALPKIFNPDYEAIKMIMRITK